MNLLVGVGIPVRIVSAFKILHDKVIVADRRSMQLGPYSDPASVFNRNAE